MFHKTRTLAVLVAAAVAPPLFAQTPPPAPTDLTYYHQHGQTFLTWTEQPGVEEYYVYRTADPIDELSDLALYPEETYKTRNGSGEFYADRLRTSLATPRFLERLVVPTSTGPRMVDPDEGIMVYTVRSGESGIFYYTIVSYDEDTGLFSDDFIIGENICGRKEEMGVDEGYTPVSIKLDNTFIGITDQHFMPANSYVCVQYMDFDEWNVDMHAPNVLNNWFGEGTLIPNEDPPQYIPPTDPDILLAKQYAYAYVVSTPTCSDACNPSQDPCLWPILLSLHPHAGNRAAAPWAMPTMSGFGKPIDGEDCHALQITPYCVGEDWWFGLDATHDYHTPLSDPEAPSATITNFTEHRLLRMIFDLFIDPAFADKVDPDRVYAYGTSMGGTGALALALRYPNVFAACDASRPATDFLAFVDSQSVSAYSDELEARWGDTSATHAGVAVLDIAGWEAEDLENPPMTGEVSIWEWQDHGQTVADNVEVESAPFGMTHGIGDGTFEYQNQLHDSYADFVDGFRTFGSIVDCDGHAPFHHFEGLPPGIGDGFPYDPYDDTCASCPGPFYDYQFSKADPVPSFADPVPVMPDQLSDLSTFDASCLTPQLPPPLLFYQGIEWSSSTANFFDLPPASSSTAWRVSIRSLSGTFSVDVTPRRCADGFIEPLTCYQWRNTEVVPGGPNDSLVGHVTSAANGHLVIPDQVFGGNVHRLLITKILSCPQHPQQ